MNNLQTSGDPIRYKQCLLAQGLIHGFRSTDWIAEDEAHVGQIVTSRGEPWVVLKVYPPALDEKVFMPDTKSGRQ